MTPIPVLAEIIGPELLIVLVIVALLFGGSQLPKLARSLGSAKSEFEKGIREGTHAAPEKSAPDPDEQVTMTRAELNRLLAEREARTRGDASPPGGAS